MPPKSKLPPKYFLIAEDDEFLADSIADLLESEGHEASTVLDGAETIVAIDKRPPDVLLLDYVMPGVDGLAVLRHCQEKGYTFPSIIITNMSNDAVKERCEALGAVGYIIKSDMDMGDLYTTIEAMLTEKKS